MYKRPYDKSYPVVNMDESPKQLIGETKTPLPIKPGQERKYDYEYERKGICNIFMACEALAGKRYVKITKRKRKKDWAVFIKGSILESVSSHFLDPLYLLEAVGRKKIQRVSLFQSTPDGNLSENSLRNALAISVQHLTLRFQLRVLCLRVKYNCFSKACLLMNAPFVLVVLRRHL